MTAKLKNTNPRLRVRALPSMVFALIAFFMLIWSVNTMQTQQGIVQRCPQALNPPAVERTSTCQEQVQPLTAGASCPDGRRLDIQGPWLICRCGG